MQVKPITTDNALQLYLEPTEPQVARRRTRKFRLTTKSGQTRPLTPIPPGAIAPIKSFLSVNDRRRRAYDTAPLRGGYPQPRPRWAEVPLWKDRQGNSLDAVITRLFLCTGTD